MKASLSESLRIPVQRRIAVLGEMKELGKNALTIIENCFRFYQIFQVFIMGRRSGGLCSKIHRFPIIPFSLKIRSLGTEIKKELGEGDPL